MNLFSDAAHKWSLSGSSLINFDQTVAPHALLAEIAAEIMKIENLILDHPKNFSSSQNCPCVDEVRVN